MRYEEIDALIPPPATTVRSEGIHLSKVLRQIAVANKSLAAIYVEDFSLIEVSGESEGWWDTLDELSKLRMAIGMAWEEWYMPKLPNVVHQPGELCLEGVFMTPDGESLDYFYTIKYRIPVPGDIIEYALHECKTTSKSTKRIEENGLEGQYLWISQCKAYCKAMGTRVCYLHVLFLCGDYKFPIRPQLRVWRIEFTQLEMDVSWETLSSYIRMHPED